MNHLKHFLCATAILLSACQKTESVSNPVEAADTSSGVSATSHKAEPERESAFGKYRGYSEATFDGFVRESRYVEVSDGTRIALDIFYPTKAGVKTQQALPVALQATRYWRAYEKEDGTIQTAAGNLPPGQSASKLKNPEEPLGRDENVNTHQELLRHGYVVVFMDSRGTGSSFGVQTPGYEKEVQDMSDVINWIAEQDWSTGKVGMFGGSWLGLIQIFTALGHPEPLAALFPAVTHFPDFNRIFSPHGAYLKGMMLTIRKTLVNLSDIEDEGQATNEGKASYFGKNIIGPPPVDEDHDRALLKAARAGQGTASFKGYIEPMLQHPTMKKVIEELSLDTLDQVIDTLFFADALNEALRGKPELRQLLADAQWPQDPEEFEITRDMVKRVNEAGIPMYFWDGWQDPIPDDPILWYFNLKVPHRLTIGPWSHGPNEPDDPSARASAQLMTIEILRWFDYWLKGIDNGIMDEAPLVYAVMQDKNRWEWREADNFPPAEAKPVPFYFSAGPSGSVASVNDGLLTRDKPVEEGHKDLYTVDYTAQTGVHTRYHDAAGGGPIEYPDLAPNDAKGLTYTTAPLEADLLTAGFPVITLYAQATVPDAVFFVYLEEVDPSGYSTMITQGPVRASHRTLWTPPYNTNGVPWTSSLEKDILATAPLTAGPAKIQYALQPVANRWDKGNRIRVTVLNADETMLWVIPHDPPPVISMWRDAEHPSHIQLHVIPDK